MASRADKRIMRPMNETPALSKYRELVTDIGKLYEGARAAVVDAYWKIGQRLVEIEQNGAERAGYGERLLERLSADLSAKHGRGFSVDNLQRMRRFYLTYPKYAPARKLGWSPYAEMAGKRGEAENTPYVLTERMESA